MKNKIVLIVMLLNSITSLKTFSNPVESVKNKQLAPTQQPQYKPKAIPIYYKKPFEKISIYEIRDMVVPGEWWIVYSNKSDNKSYSDTTCTTLKSAKIGFLESFYVAEETNRLLHIFQDFSFDKGNFSSNATDYGWIDKKDLLLWSRSLLNTKGYIDRKAMIMNTIETIKEEKISDNLKDVVKFCNDPNLQNENNHESRIYQIFYIYNITDKAVLLGESPRITDPDKIKDNIWGWVPRTKVTLWDHRIAIEPNWEKEASNERRNKGIKPSFFTSEEEARKFKVGQNYDNNTVVWDDDFYENRPIGDWKRFPLLALSKDSTLAKVGVMGEISSTTGSTVNQQQYASYQRSINELRANKQKINIVFVVDGTHSMKDFFKPICDAISSSMEELSSYGNGNVFNFGVVIYRDFHYNDKITETSPLTSQYKNVVSFLDQTKAFKSYTQNDNPEAVNYGLNTALRELNFNAQETNIIFLVGDAGNHHRDDESQVKEEEIIEQLLKKRCSIMAFQANHYDHESCDEFIPQAKAIIHKAANKLMPEYEKLAIAANMPLAPPQLVKSIKSNVEVLTNSPFLGKVVSAPKGGSLKPTELFTEIKDMIALVNNHTEKKLKMMKGMIDEGQSIKEVVNTTNSSSTDEFSTTFKPALFLHLSEYGISEEQIKSLSGKKIQLYIKGFTPLSVNGLNYPLYKKVLLFSLSDLGDLLREINNLNDAGSGNEQREAMQRAWKELLKKHEGGLSSAQMEKMTFENINEKVYGLPGTSKLLKVKLGDLIDKAVVDNIQFNEYKNLINKKYNELQKLYNGGGGCAYCFRSNDITYIWIAQDLLP